MTIYRGPGGGGNADSDAEINALTALTNQALAYSEAAELEADAAAASAAAASTSAASAATSASGAATSATNAASSASSASTSASSASTNATNAAASASSASTSATNAASSASVASTSATNAAASETNAATSASSASTYATASAASAVTASTQASNAATSATAAAGSATTASTQASNAATSASGAATSATNASNSASAASTSAANALASETAAAASVASIDLPTIVRTTGNQTIEGIKTFSSTIVGSISGNSATATTATNQSGGTVSATSIAYSTTLTGGTGVVNLGSGQVYKDASGNLGIGTTSPVAKLAVVGGTSNASSLATAYSLAAFNITPKSTSGYSLQFGSGPGDLPYIQMSAGGAASGDMTLQPYGGNVGIGITNPSANGSLAVLSPAGGIAYGLKGRSADGYGRFQAWDRSGTVPTGSLAFSEDGTIAFNRGNTGTLVENARIDSSGNLLVGRTSTGGTAAVSIERPANTATYIYQMKSGQVECTWGFKASTDTNMYIGSGSTAVGTNGVYLTNTGNSWNAVSDERMKTIVEPIANAADKVATLRAVIGYYNHDEKQIRRPFLIAQDVQAVLPEAVNIQDPETGTLGMSYTDTIPLLVAAIKEQQTTIVSLQDTLTALTARITALETA